MSYLVNPSNLIVEIDDPSQVEKRLNQGFRMATQSEIDEHLRDRREQIEFEQNAKGGQSIYFISANPKPDGYGTSSGALESYLSKEGVYLSRAYRGQKVGLLYSYPTKVEELQTDVKIIYSMFESTEIPSEWKKDCDKADLVITPTQFCQDAFKRAGIDSHLIPLGYDDKIFTYKPKEKKDTFTFLMYNAFDSRKGWDILFKAFNEEFKKHEPVKLVLKTIFERLPISIPRSQYPNIEVIKDASPQSKLADLLHEADCFVFPSRGEGFGHPPLEALATGTPVIVPNGSGMSEYFDERYMYELKIARNRPAFYSRFKGRDLGSMIEPDVKDLRKKMRYVYENRNEAYEKARLGAKWVAKTYSWVNTAKKLAPILKRYSVDQAGKTAFSTNSNKPLVSIVMLTHNALKYTKKAIASIKNNTSVPYELIIIDNASTDDTQKYLKTLKTATVILNKKNKGVAGGRNQGIKEASGEFITFLDNDVEVGEGWMQTILKEFQDEKVGAVGLNGTIVKQLKPIIFANPQLPTGRGEVDVIPGFCSSYPTKILREVGDFYEGLTNPLFWHEDLDLCLRIKDAGYKVIDNREIAIKHHGHQSVGEGVSDREIVEKVKGFYENAADIMERRVSSNRVTICRQVTTDSIASYDRVADKLTDKLRQKGYLVKRTYNQPTPPRSFNLCKGFDILHNGKRYVWIHQENDKAPEDWDEAFKHVDKAFCASEHVYKVLSHESYRSKLINLSPNFVDDSVFNYKVKPLDIHKGKKIFLHVSASQPRKGVDVLIKAWTSVYKSNKDVVLIIKDGGYGYTADTAKLIRQSGCKNIEHITEQWSDEYLARMYKTVAERGAYVHTHRAEAFGLPIIEALACGARVGATNWGGVAHYGKNYKNVTLFDYKMQPSSFHNHSGEPYYKHTENPQWAEPSIDSVKKFLENVVNEDYDGRVSYRMSQKVISQFGVDSVLDKFIDKLNELSRS